ncbi:DUF916 and DUF3324 domain-containing protein [Enterococcus sp. DIV0876]|uniref:DUF916 and DUF3324 domain-containing protein n=1 Tax=Enterococcus sp. DIV0876 TaxID=2774633 RepID=UPI003D2FF138
MRYLHHIGLCLLIAFGLYYLTPAVQAEEAVTNGDINYSVQKIQPEGAIKEGSSFYDLLVSPGDFREIQAKITNSGEETITVYSEIFTTFTNANGEINYTSAAKTYDKSLAFKISDFATVVASDIKAEIPAGETRVVTAQIHVPDDIEDGVYLGSWYFEKELQVTEDSSQEGISIKNKYSYAVAVKLTVNQEIDAPNLHFVNVTTGLKDYQKAIFANIQNDQPAIVGKLSYQAKIMKKNSYDVLYESSSEGLMMAPNSNYAYPILLDGDQMTGGDYTLYLTVTTQDAKWEETTWEWQKDFTITNQEAAALNDAAINDPEPESKGWIWLLIGILTLIIFLLILLLFRSRRGKIKR